MSKILEAFFLIVFVMIASVNAQSNNVIIIGNSHIEVGVLPEIGGRVVLLRKPGCNNILKSEVPSREVSKQKPEVSAFSEFKAFNGHMVWVGPQNEWWMHQDLNKRRKMQKAVWPPDPYLIYGAFEVVAQNDTMISMAGPESPISGVRLCKNISIDSRGMVTFTATAENIRTENVSWDLWMNTRLHGFARCLVPVEKDGVIDLLKKDDETIQATPYTIIDGFFTYVPSLPPKPKREQVQETHLDPSRGFMAGIDEQQLLIIGFDKIKQDRIHPHHGQVELYSYINDTGEETLLELELHGAYQTLEPGETMSLTETWQLESFKGIRSMEEQIGFVREILTKLSKKP
ncbi:MAG: DUF4380 domain-containing protein [bacterium]